MTNYTKPKAICNKCAKERGLDFFLLSPQLIKDYKCMYCNTKYNLVHYQILKDLNKF